MSDQFHERPLVLLNAATITKNGTVTGEWFNCPRAQAFNFCYRITSAGAPDITIYIDYWLWPKGDTVKVADIPPTFTPTAFAPEYAAVDNDISVSLVTGVLTLDAWTHVDTPDGLKYPFACCRARAVENNVAAVTGITVVMGYQGL